MNIGIIGFGRIGSFIASHLSKEFKVSVYEREDKKEAIQKANATPAELKEVCQQNIVIPCVPISEFESTIKEIAPLLKPGTLVADVCSVKEFPLSVMEKELPEEIEILATHPMFGPDSAKETLYGSKIVLCPLRVETTRYENIKSYLSSAGLKVIETTAEDHDEQISHSLLLAHYIGRALIDMKAKDLEIDTKGYRRLMKILETVENDSYQLFIDMNKHNRFSKSARADFLSSLQKLEKDVK